MKPKSKFIAGPMPPIESFLDGNKMSTKYAPFQLEHYVEVEYNLAGRAYSTHDKARQAITEQFRAIAARDGIKEFDTAARAWPIRRDGKPQSLVV